MKDASSIIWILIQFKAFDYFTRQINVNKNFKSFYSSVRIDEILEKEGKIERFLSPGQPIIVQIVKEPISTKGSRLTAEVSIAGRNMVLPCRQGQRIAENQIQRGKRRLERLVYSTLPAIMV